MTHHTLSTNDSDDVVQRAVHQCVLQAVLALNGGAEYTELLRDWVPSTITRTVRYAAHQLQGKPWDYEVRTGTSLYHRYRDSCGSLQLISDLGLRRTFLSPFELGCTLAQQMEEQQQHSGDDWFLLEGFTISVSPQSGFVLLVSPARRNALYETANRLPCPHCSQWLQGTKGLWWHQQQQHGQTHATATTRAGQAQIGSHAMVLYQPIIQSMLHHPKIPHSLEPCARTVTTTPFEMAANGDLNGLKNCIQKASLDPNHEVDPKGATVLLWAAGGGNLDIVKFLVEHCQVDINRPQQGRRAFGGRTALHWAARKGHVSVVQYLLQAGANVEAETTDGTTALCWAAWQNHLPVLQVLVRDAGANIQTTNSYGCNAALWAAQGLGTVECLEWLEAAGCSIWQVNSNGHSVLHKAAQWGRRPVALWCLDRLGQRLETSSSGGKENNDSNTSAILWKIVGPDGEGCTPSDLAGMEGHTDLARILANREQELSLSYSWNREITRIQEPSYSMAVVNWTENETKEDEEGSWGPFCGLRRIQRYLSEVKDKHTGNGGKIISSGS